MRPRAAPPAAPSCVPRRRRRASSDGAAAAAVGTWTARASRGTIHPNPSSLAGRATSAPSRTLRSQALHGMCFRRTRGHTTRKRRRAKATAGGRVSRRRRRKQTHEPASGAAHIPVKERGREEPRLSGRRARRGRLSVAGGAGGGDAGRRGSRARRREGLRGLRRAEEHGRCAAPVGHEHEGFCCLVVVFQGPAASLKFRRTL